MSLQRERPYRGDTQKKTARGDRSGACSRATLSQETPGSVGSRPQRERRAGHVLPLALLKEPPRQPLPPRLPASRAGGRWISVV